MTVIDRAFTTVEIAELLDTNVWNVQRWVRRRDRRRWTGSGYQHRLTIVDLMACRALQVVYGESAGGTAAMSRIAEIALEAIDHRSCRWLLVSADGAETFETAEEAALAWAESPGPRPAVWLIDLLAPVAEAVT